MTLAQPLDGATIRSVTIDDLPGLYELEAESYPADEAATEEKMLLRIREAPEFFRAAYDANGLAGFINGTCVPLGEPLTEDAMATHSPGGGVLCIHSVVVAASRRR